MATRLYPPQLNGVLPAFYRNYDEEGKLIGASITVPFGLTRGVDLSSIAKVVIKLRTTSTNIYILSDVEADSTSIDDGYATFNLLNENDLSPVNQINESQYYRIQLAFKDNLGVVGYYSTVGVIKCIAKPRVEINDYENDKINAFTNVIIGTYTQNTDFGDSTEKAYSYIFNLWDSNNEIVATSGEQVHDFTQDDVSASSSDTFTIYKELNVGEVYKLQYTVTTINGLVISTDKYKVIRFTPINPQYSITLHGEVNYDKGCIDLKLSGENIEHIIPKDTYIRYESSGIRYSERKQDETYFYKDSNTNIYYEITNEEQWELYKNDNLYIHIVSQKIIGEESVNGNFLITRASNLDDFFEWQELLRFTLNQEFPSEFPVSDFTVEQGVTYKYAIQQYNIYDVYSEKNYLTNNNGEEITITADFEDMFIYDGDRQLRVRFNPKISSFKNTIPEQKIETIGSKYPFIFRNGVVSYKEFPIAGLISYQLDDAMLFLNKDEAKEAGILEKESIRSATNIIGTNTGFGHESNYAYTRTKVNILDPFTNQVIGYRIYEETKLKPEDQRISYVYDILNRTNYDTGAQQGSSIIRANRDLTSENMMGERYFKLKVLDWLSDGKVKLFRSPAEGNYLIRLLKVSMKPEDKLGRMIHSFSCTAYEIAEVNYQNLVEYRIIRPNIENDFEIHYGSLNIVDLLSSSEPDEDGFYQANLPSDAIINLEFTDFAAGDQIRVVYNDTDEDSIHTYTIGITGNLDLSNDSRIITELWIKPNPNAYGDFSRTILYAYNGLRTSQFDTIADVNMKTQIAEQFIGPKTNLLDTYILNGKRIEDIAAAIDARDYLNFNINTKVEKFKALKIDILHIHKRPLIPIFSYKNTVNASTKFGVTPFGRGYVNGENILKYIDNNQNLKIANENFLTLQPPAIDGGINEFDLQTILDGNKNPNIKHYAILEVFIYDENEGAWVPNTGSSYHYFDTYTNSWWNKNEIYSPTFQINSKDTSLDSNIQDGNIININELEEVTYYNLEEIEKITLGNGVAAEITAEIRIIDYNVEKVDPEVLAAKNEYEAAKTTFQENLKTVHLQASAIAEARTQLEELNQKIINIQKQLAQSGSSTTANSNIKQITEAILIEQKQLIYYDLRTKIEAILTLLKNLDMPLSLDTNGQIIYGKALIDAVYQDSNVTNPMNNLSDDQQRILKLWQYKNFDPDIINEFDYVYVDEQSAIIEEYTTLNNNLQNQIDILSAELGALSGTYDSTVNDGADTEGTITYYENQLANINQRIDELNEAHSEKTIDLLNQIIIKLLYGNGTKDFVQLTDSYIRENAQALIGLIEGLKEKQEEALETIRNDYEKLMSQWYNFTYVDDTQLADWGDNYNNKPALRFTPWNDATENGESPWRPENHIIPANYDAAISRIDGYKGSILLTRLTLSNGNFNTRTNQIDETDTSFKNMIINLPLKDSSNKDIITARTKISLSNQAEFKILCGRKRINNNTNIIQSTIEQDISEYIIPEEVPEEIDQLIIVVSASDIDNNVTLEYNNWDTLYAEAREAAATSIEGKMKLAAFNYILFYNQRYSNIFNQLNLYQTQSNSIKKELDDLNKQFIWENFSNFTISPYYINNNRYTVIEYVGLRDVQARWGQYGFESVTNFIEKATELNETASVFKTTIQEVETLLSSDENDEAIKENVMRSLAEYRPEIEAIIELYQFPFEKAIGAFESKITSYESVLETLNSIILNPGTYERIPTTYVAADIDNRTKQNFKTTIENLATQYKQDIASKVAENPILNNLNLNIADKIYASTPEELITLFVDNYNKGAGSTIAKMLATYNVNEDEEEDVLTTLQNQIHEAQASYDTLLLQYNEQKTSINNSITELRNRTTELANNISNMQREMTENQRVIDAAQAEIDRYSEDSDEVLLDSPRQPAYIYSASNIGKNITIVTNYINKLYSTAFNLQNDIQDVYTNTNNTAEYIEQLKDWINSDEAELFQLCHRYDSIEEDLSTGLDGRHGMDRYFSYPEGFNLYNYKDIFLLGFEDDIIEENDKQTIINNLQSNNRVSINAGLNALKDALEQRLLRSASAITFRLFRYKQEGQNNEKYYICTSLKNGTNSDQYYPLPGNNDLNGFKFWDNDDSNKSKVPPTYTNGDWVRRKDGQGELRRYPQGITYNASQTYYLSNKEVYKYKNQIQWEKDLREGKIYWLTGALIQTFSIQPYNPLYKNLDFNTSVITIGLDDSNFSIIPDTEYTYWKGYIGDMIYLNEVDEKNTLSAILIKEKTYREIFVNYLKAVAIQDYILCATNEGKSYSADLLQLNQYNDQLDGQRKILGQCQIILANWDANEEKDNSTEKQQLELLITTTERKIAALEASKATLQNKINTVYNDFLINTYNPAITRLTESNNARTQALTDLNNNYDNYARKVNRYLSLLFNSTYHLGLGYAILQYKINKNKLGLQNNTPDVNLSEIINKLSKHLNLFTEVSSASGNQRYYNEDLSTLYTSGNVSIYSCAAPTLLDIIPTNFIPSTNDPLKQQYKLVNGVYKKANDNDVDDLYEIQDNGGFIAIMNNLEIDGSYVANIIKTYQDTLILYEALLEENLTEDSTRAELQRLLAQYNQEKISLENIANQPTTLDETVEINRIKEALVQYLFVLTKTYVEQVERRYGV